MVINFAINHNLFKHKKFINFMVEEAPGEKEDNENSEDKDAELKKRSEDLKTQE